MMKKFILRFCSITTCIILLIACCGVPSGAVTSEYDTPEYLLQRGWLYDVSDGSYYLPSGVVDSYIASFPANMMAATPYYPTFDINRLPWQAAPDNVLKYINMVYSYPPDVVPHVPFICVRVSANSVHVYVGYNLGFGYDSYYDRYLICTTYPSNSVCYSATFRRSNYSVYEDWHQLSCSDLGDTGRVYAYTPTLAYAGTSEYDFYFSGGSGLKSYSAGNGWTSLSYIIRSANDYPVFFYCDSALGFAKGYFAYYQNNIENINYYQYFRPLTSTQQQIQQNQQIIDGQQDMNNKLESMPGEFASELDEQIAPSKQPDLDTSASDALSKAESDLFTSNYNPDNFKNDFKINLDGAAVGAVFGMMDAFVQLDNEVYAGIIMILVLGVIALIFNR